MELDKKINCKIANGGIIAAAMVVGIHVCSGGEIGSSIWWWNCLIAHGIFLIAVPFFFVCSGYFLCRHYVSGRVVDIWRLEMEKRIGSLLVPFMIWSVIGICLYEMLPVRIVTNLICGHNLFANFPDKWRFWARGLGVYPYAYPLVVPLWYVRSLLIFAVLSPILVKLIEKWGGVKICLALYSLWALLGASPETGNRVHLICSYCISLQGLFFFTIGCALARAEETKILRVQNFITQRKILLGCLCAGLGILVLRAWLWQRTGWTIRHWALLFVPSLLLVFWEILPSRPMPRWLTSSAFPVYLIHPLFWLLIAKFCVLFYRNALRFMTVETLGEWWIKWVVGFCGSIVLSLLMHRVLPRTSCVLFGGR